MAEPWLESGSSEDTCPVAGSPALSGQKVPVVCWVVGFRNGLKVMILSSDLCEKVLAQLLPFVSVQRCVSWVPFLPSFSFCRHLVELEGG